LDLGSEAAQTLSLLGAQFRKLASISHS